MAHQAEKKRGRRRRITMTIAMRRRDEHLAIHHPDGSVDCPPEVADTYFAKRAVRACDCRKRRHGQPKLDAGNLCCVGMRDRVFRWRGEDRLLMAAALAGRGYAD